jgi:hypothetical protein
MFLNCCNLNQTRKIFANVWANVFTKCFLTLAPARRRRGLQPLLKLTFSFTENYWLVMKKMRHASVFRVARFFLVCTKYQNGRKIHQWPQAMYTKRPRSLPNGRKILQISIKYTNIFPSNALQNLPKSEFLVWRYNHLATLLPSAGFKGTKKASKWKHFVKKSCLRWAPILRGPRVRTSADRNSVFIRQLWNHLSNPKN